MDASLYVALIIGFVISIFEDVEKTVSSSVCQFLYP